MRFVFMKESQRPRTCAVAARSLKVKVYEGMSRVKLVMLGIGQTQLSKYEKGLSAPTLELLLKLKAYSGRSLDWIVTGGEGV
jgi:transcriptional regulator with XRE-family HTH domain